MLQFPYRCKTVQSRTHDTSRGVFLVTWLASGALAFAATQLALTLTLPQHPVLAGVRVPMAPDTGSATGGGTDPLKWPALFGVPAAAPAPEPVAAPVVSATYALKGLVAGRDGGFAILADATSELMVRQGDVLGDGSVVARIDRHGVVLDLNGQMITVNFRDSEATGPAPVPGRPETVAGPAPVPAAAVQLDLGKLNQSGIRRMLGRAGAVTQVVLPDGTQALDILWIRKGQLYENLGLTAGDRVLRINGIAAGDNQALLQSMGTLLSSDAYRLDIIRNGRLREITVTLVENG